MLRHTRLIVLLVAAAWLAGCGEMRSAGSGHYYLRHQVKAGDTLYSIAWRFGYDYREVAAWNRIAAPYRIYIGQELLILAPDRFNMPDPAAAPTAAVAIAAPAPVASPPREDTPAVANTQAPVQPSKPVQPARVAVPRPAVSRAPSSSTAIHWKWPTEGKIVSRFAAGQGRKGVDVSGRIGQPVRAAADGEVVYSGSGLIGYGNLVIVKHDDVFLSAYGHNRRLLVKEGDKVRQGSTLGEMGQGSKGLPILHFEIRKNGKPIDPLLYLPDS